MDKEEFMLTTVDNPYNPFTQFKEWFAFDMEKGYHSCSVLGMFAKTSPALSDADNNLEISRAIDEIIQFDFRHIFKKVGQQAIEKYVS